MILCLATELLQEIGMELSQRDQAHFRAATKYLARALNPVFFSLVTIKTGTFLHHGNKRLGSDLLTALATGDTGWNAHARELVITHGPWFAPQKRSPEEALKEEETQRLLTAALGALVHVHAVKWEMSSRMNLPYQRAVIYQFLEKSTNLEVLDVDVSEHEGFDFPQLGGLRSITLKTPGRLPSFPGHGQSAGGPPVYPQLLKLVVTQKQLSVLHLEGSKLEWSGIWGQLRQARVHLTELTTGIVTQEFMDYLSSYTGLKKLSLTFHDYMSREENNLAEAFYARAIAPHIESLVELCCPAGYESDFSFGPHNVAVVYRFTRLRHLGMSVNAPRVEFNEMASPRGIEDYSVQIEQTDIDTTVNSLLDTAATYSRLRTLSIFAAEPERNRALRHGHGFIHQRRAVEVAITRATKSYHWAGPARFAVFAGDGRNKPSRIV
ncbi:hypothetical protein FB45DRAFT_906140 [Roridomyces roridus]|uniref:Uncharacterized protein n=1 Tax=Roridomyces roridus TaxID=1738132 RepID=A0AAD7C0G8_9AGAR|nr:hypothetical protein FB45DRAFT_906140 [Roridomyces roridus]